MQLSQEDILLSPSDGDLGAILGLGFPPFLGGPFRYIDKIGVGEVNRILGKLQKDYGVRFKAADLLTEMESNNRTFYPG